MSEADHRPVVDFDHHSPEFNADPHAAWQSLGERCPTGWSEHYAASG